MTVSGLSPIERDAREGSTQPKPAGNDSGQQARLLKPNTPSDGLRGNDTIAGYSVTQSNFSTSGGLTFHVYNDAETDKAIEWGVDSPRVHYDCNAMLECTLRRSGSSVILHVHLRK